MDIFWPSNQCQWIIISVHMFLHAFTLCHYFGLRRVHRADWMVPLLSLHLRLLLPFEIAVVVVVVGAPLSPMQLFQFSLNARSVKLILLHRRSLFNSRRIQIQTNTAKTYIHIHTHTRAFNYYLCRTAPHRATHCTPNANEGSRRLSGFNWCTILWY